MNEIIISLCVQFIDVRGRAPGERRGGGRRGVRAARAGRHGRRAAAGAAGAAAAPRRARRRARTRCRLVWGADLAVLAARRAEAQPAPRAHPVQRLQASRSGVRGSGMDFDMMIHRIWIKFARSWHCYAFVRFADWLHVDGKRDVAVADAERVGVGRRVVAGLAHRARWRAARAPRLRHRHGAAARAHAVSTAPPTNTTHATHSGSKFVAALAVPSYCRFQIRKHIVEVLGAIDASFGVGREFTATGETDYRLLSYF